jgi:hypothetical protein
MSSFELTTLKMTSRVVYRLILISKEHLQARLFLDVNLFVIAKLRHLVLRGQILSVKLLEAKWTGREACG